MSLAPLLPEEVPSGLSHPVLRIAPGFLHHPWSSEILSLLLLTGRLPGRRLCAGRGDFFTLGGSLVVALKVCSSSCFGLFFSENALKYTYFEQFYSLLGTGSKAK